MLFITLAVSLILVALIVLALKNHQQRRLEDLASREHSLPPLDYNQNDEPGHTADSPPSELEPEPEPANIEPAQTTESVEDKTIDWKQACKEHRQAQRFEKALQAAKRGWPQVQSYEQTALTIRAAIKQTTQSPSSTVPQADSPAMQSLLEALYRNAAEASLLHDNLPDEPQFRDRVSALLSNREALDNIHLPWHDIGANSLKLLTKTDRKLLIQAWGEPRQHISAQSWHRHPQIIKDSKNPEKTRNQ